jgi:hypothetical protein
MQDENKFYSKILINKTALQSLRIMMFFFSILFTYLIFTELVKGAHWLTVATPLIPLGLLFVVHPKTEEWQYEAWQGRARRIERHFIE